MMYDPSKDFTDGEDLRDLPLGSPPPPAPTSGYLENYRVSRQEQVQAANTNAVDRRRAEAFYSVVDLINQTLSPRERFLSPGMLPERPMPGVDGGRWRDGEWGRIVGEIQRRRNRDPDFLKEVPLDLPGFYAWADQRAKKAVTRNEEVYQRAGVLGTIGNFVGGTVGAVEDPVNLATLPLGGWGKTPLMRIGTEIGANMAVETATQPFTARNYRNLGFDYTIGDAAKQVLFAGAAAGTIRGGIEAAPVLGRFTGKAYDRTVEGVFNAIPEGLQRRWADAGTLEGRNVVEAFRATVDPERVTPDERAAISVIEREAEIREASPYERSPAGEQANREGMYEAFARIVTERPAPSVPRATVTRSALLGEGTDLSSLRLPAREQVKARIRRAESGGDDRAKNPKSSATGRYQFTRGTWQALFKRRYPNLRLASDAIWAKRFDSDLQEVLMDDLLADSGKRLRDAGLPETAGNLYMLHFSGAKGVDILRADPALPAARFYSAPEIAANKRVLEGKSVGEVIAWARRAVRDNGAPPVRVADSEDSAIDPTLAARTAEDEVIPIADVDAYPDWPDSPGRPAVRADMFATAEEHARAQLARWDEHDAAEGFARVVDDPPPPGPTVEVKAKAERKRYGRIDVMQAIADAGGLADNEGHDLVAGRNIPKFLLGAGAVIRPEGTKGVRSLDQVGEHLWEKGYFGPPETTPRPTIDGVLQLIERGAREKVYLPEEVADALPGRAVPGEDEVTWELDSTARDLGHELDPVTLDDALSRRARGAAVEDAVTEAVEAARFRDLSDSAGLERFDDPDGEGLAAQLDSLEHDLRMQMEMLGDRTITVDAEGDVTLGALLDALDDDLSAIDAMRGCMTPVKEAAE